MENILITNETILEDRLKVKECKSMYKRNSKKKGYIPLIRSKVVLQTGGQVPTLKTVTYSLNGERIVFPEYRNLSIEEIINRN